MKMRYTIYVFIFSFFFILSSQEARSKSTSWNKPAVTTGLWNDAGNWTNGVPAPGDDVTINSTNNTTITNIPEISLNSLTIQGTCYLTSSASGSNSNILTITGSFAINNGATLNIGNSGTQNLELILDSSLIGTLNGNLFIWAPSNKDRTITVNGKISIAASYIISGSATHSIFVLNTGATLEIANSNGISVSGATGAVQTSTRTYNINANYIYNGISAQITGNGLTQNTPANLTINNGSLGGVTLSAATTINGLLTMTNGTLDIANTNLTIGGLTGTGNITNASGTAGARTITIGSDNTTHPLYGGIISNGTATSVALTKTGTGTLTLSGANSFTGAVTVSSGVLNIQNSTATGSTAGGVTVASGAALELQGGISIGSESLSIIGSGISSAGVLRNISGNNSWGGLITQTGASTISSDAGTLTIDVASGNAITGAYNLLFTGTGNITVADPVATTSGTITKSGNGTLTLSGISTSGTTTVSAGLLQFGSAISTTGNFVLSGGSLSTGSSSGYNVTTTGTLDLQATSTIALGSGSHNLTFAASNGVTWGAGTLKITGWVGNWDGTTGTSGKIFFGLPTGLTASQIQQIRFIDSFGSYYAAGILPDGELVPLNQVMPEPPTVVSPPISSGPWFVPSCIASITIHAWGGGGGGGAATGTPGNIGAGGGGGGGAYNVFSLSVTPGQEFTVAVGDGGTANPTTDGGPGGVTSVVETTSGVTIITANGGSGGVKGNRSYGTGGLGGTAVAPGKNGGNGGTSTGNGAGGGGGAGSGTNGSNGTNTSFGAGGTGTYPGGNGGNFVSGFVVGFNGTFPGGGGGGARSNSSTNNSGGLGANGQVIIVSTYAIPEILPGSNPSVCQGSSAATLNYSNATGCPDQFSIDYDISAEAQGFVDVSYTSLLPGSISLVVPPAAPAGTYNAFLKVRNSTSLSQSIAYNISITISQNIWTGFTSSDWNTASNWCGNSVPAATSDVVIQSAANPPIISTSPGAQCKDLTINSGSLTVETGQSLTVEGNLTNSPGGSLIIISDLTTSGSLIVKGTSTGNVTYNRQLRIADDSGNRHLISSPVGSQTITDFNTINPNVTRIRTYQETDDTWPNISSPNFNSGQGYLLTQNTSSLGNISFTGTVVTSDVVISASSPYSDVIDGTELNYDSRSFAPGRGLINYGGGGWNLLGNPYTSSFIASDFINLNLSNFDPNYVALYLFDGTALPNGAYYYIANSTGWPDGTSSSETHVQAGQGFFVLAMNDNSTFTFNRSFQAHNTAAKLFKSAKADTRWPGLQLKVLKETLENHTTVVFNDKMTVGLDPGYDVGLYSSGTEMEIYTILPEINNGISYSRQALPSIGFNPVVLPVGINTEEGGEVVFSADIVPLEGYKFYLEDRPAGIFTDLSEGNYTVTINPATYGTGQFYIHTSSSLLTNVEPVSKNPELENLRLWVSDNTLIIKGNVGPRTSCEVYDMNGRKILDKTLGEGEMNSVAMPSGSRGVFIVRVKDGLKINTLKAVMP